MEPVSTSGFTALLKLYGIAIMVTLAVGLVAAVINDSYATLTTRVGSWFDLYGCIKFGWRLIHYCEVGTS